MSGEIETVIAVDVGGTEIKGAVCDAGGAALAQRRRPTPVSAGVPAVLDEIAGLITELASAAESTVRGVGLIMPGVVDAAAGIARYSTNIGWRDLAIRDQIRDRVGLPVAIEHDVRAGGLAEARLGAAHGVDEALFLAIGTGIAGASILGGRLVTGAGNLAGEIGHLPVFPDGELCACGQRGCTETYASAAALPRRYRTLGGTGGERPEQIRAEQVIERAEAGDPIAVRVFDEAITALARALVSYILLLDPALIVIGGGLSLAGDRLLVPLVERIGLGLVWRDVPELVTARFGADSGRVGAALVGWQAYRSGLLATVPLAATP
ncbi:MAG: ROK family protein [Actinomycetota bacterium]|nr:ROK family protein [Actinomycetota bacterium]MDQ2958416.1 ROK family protein [Actinomycetota bacterium]